LKTVNYYLKNSKACIEFKAS